MEKTELTKLLEDTIANQQKIIHRDKHILVTLIISWLLTACFCVGAFVWYESQFEYTDETTETTVYTESDDANAEYNDIEGDQYNDNATNAEGVE